MDEICRVCLKFGELIPIFKNSDCSIANSLKDMASLQIKEDDGLPQSICEYCKKDLETCVNFVNVCQESDRLLKFSQRQSNDDLPIGNSKALKAFKCKFCPKSFDIERFLKAHVIKIHSRQNCEKCGENFHTRGDLQLHEKEKHSGRLQDYKCYLCGEKCESTRDVLRHIKENHSEENKVIPNRRVASNQDLVQILSKINLENFDIVEKSKTGDYNNKTVLSDNLNTNKKLILNSVRTIESKANTSTVDKSSDCYKDFNKKNYFNLKTQSPNQKFTINTNFTSKNKFSSNDNFTSNTNPISNTNCTNSTNPISNSHSTSNTDPTKLVSATLPWTLYNSEILTESDFNIIVEHPDIMENSNLNIGEEVNVVADPSYARTSPECNCDDNVLNHEYPSSMDEIIVMDHDFNIELRNFDRDTS